MKPSLIIGVDPGKSGAIAILRTQDLKLALFSMPLFTVVRRDGKKKQWIDCAALALKISKAARYAPGKVMAVVELVGARVYTDNFGNRRGQGAAASFEFGKSAGIIEGIFAAFNIPVTSTHPAVWKSLLNLSSNKDESRELAATTFPFDCERFARRKDDGLAEAALLAWLGYKAFYLQTVDLGGNRVESKAKG